MIDIYSCNILESKIRTERRYMKVILLSVHKKVRVNYEELYSQNEVFSENLRNEENHS